MKEDMTIPEMVRFLGQRIEHISAPRPQREDDNWALYARFLHWASPHLRGMSTCYTGETLVDVLRQAVRDVAEREIKEGDEGQS